MQNTFSQSGNDSDFLTPSLKSNPSNYYSFWSLWENLIKSFFLLTGAEKFYPSPYFFVTNCTSGLKGLLLWPFLKPLSIWCKYLRPPRQTNGHSDKNETFRQEGQPLSNWLPTFEFNVNWFIIDISKSQWMFSWKFHNCTVLTWANSTNQASWPSWRTCLRTAIKVASAAIWNQNFQFPWSY